MQRGGIAASATQPFDFRRRVAINSNEFRSDLAHVTEREVQLLRDVANAPIEEIGPRKLSNQYERKYFSRLTEKALLQRVGRGRYKLYHPLFRLFLKEG
jgi:predicted transcriptional regulator of viral defense system